MTQEVEREIVLGNKQLISLFFVVVALCGVVFALGYMMGSNRTKPVTANLDAPATTAASASSPSPAQAVPQDSEPPRETASVDTAAAGPAPTENASTTPTPVTPAAETKPAQDTPAAAESSGAIWLQVAAQKRPDADNLVKTLREQKFPAVVANSSKADLFRVLVGPYHQMTDVADAKSKLKALGFANAFVQR